MQNRKSVGRGLVTGQEVDAEAEETEAVPLTVSVRSKGVGLAFFGASCGFLGLGFWVIFEVF